jgi:hypothetical protein
MFTAFTVCAMCGVVHLGGDDTYKMSTMAPLGSAPHIAPYAVSNMFLMDHCVAPNGRWYVCPCCRASATTQALRAHFLPQHSVSYATALLASCPMKTMLLSIADVGVAMTRRLTGFAHGSTVPSVFDGALVAWGFTPTVLDVPGNLLDLLALNMVTNPLYHAFKCMLEQESPSFPVPILPQSTVEAIVTRHRARGLVNGMQQEMLPFVLSTFVTHDPQFLLPANDNIQLNKYILHTGNLVRRTGGGSVPLHTLLTGDNLAAVVLGSTSHHTPSVEQALFPFLFPHGRGHHTNAMRFCDYLRFRCSQLFSLFTLFKPYLLMMFQLRQAYLLASATPRAFLERDLVQYKARHPGCTDEDAIAHVLKFSIPSSLSGSPAWHRKNLADLLQMVKDLGMPAFFLTLTADESSEMKWSEITNLESFMQQFNASFTYADAPVECTKHFVSRVQRFMKDFILNNAGSHKVLGDVDHYLLRYECQHRGSLHAHIILWCDEADVATVADEIVAAVPADYDHVNQQFVPPSDPTQLELYQLVIRKQMHVCTEAGCRANGACKYGFPHASHPQRQCTYNPATKRWQYYRPSPAHRNVVPYHPTLLLLWGAHMNIQRITNEAWSRYVLKYTLKCEPHGTLNLDTAAVQALGLQDLSQTQLTAIASLYFARPVSPCEAALGMLKVPVVQKSDAVLSTCSLLPQHRTRIAPGNSRAFTITVAPVDKYMSRPEAAQDCTFYDYFRNYDITSSPTSVRGANLVGTDAFNNFVYRLPAPRIMRYTDYHPGHDSEGFFYNVLLQHIPFRSEEELLSPHNVERSYFVECFARGILQDDDDVDAYVDEYCQRHLYDEENRQHLTTLIQQQRANQPAVPDLLYGQDTAAADHAPSQPSQPLPFAYMESTTLNDEQQAVFDAIRANPTGMHIISGCPGSGKTFLTKYIAHHFQSTGKHVLLCATTGAAATRLGPSATTVHTAFALPRKGQLRPLPRTSAVYNMLQAADVVMLDEFSMLTSLVLNCAMYRFQQSMPAHLAMQQLLQNRLVILVGDGAQLPPVCHHKVPPDSICSKCHVSTSPYFQQATRHALRASVRHASDPAYVAFLDIIRVRPPTQDEIDAALGKCIASPTDNDRIMQATTTVLSSHVPEMVLFNESYMAHLFAQADIMPVRTLSNATAVPELQEWLHDPHFNLLPQVAVGAKVMITQNLDLSLGAANGAMCTVAAVHTATDGEVRSITVRITATGSEFVVKRTTISSLYHNGRHYYKTCFPLQLAYSITGHKSQGATISDLCVVYVRDAFAPGLLYVMLSRVTNRTNLLLLRRLTPQDFVPIPAVFRC